MQTDWEVTVDDLECHGIMLIIHENGHPFFHRKFVTNADGLGVTVNDVKCHRITPIIHENGHPFFHRKFATDADGLGGDCR